jgi:ribosomal protein L34E
MKNPCQFENAGRVRCQKCGKPLGHVTASANEMTSLPKSLRM